MYPAQLTHRERILAAVRHSPVDRCPTDMWATPEVQEMLFDYMGIRTAKGTDSRGIGLNGGELSRDATAILELWDRLEIDGILTIRPPYMGPAVPHGENEWGVRFAVQGYGTGRYLEQVSYPLARAESIDDLERYRWPDPDWYDYGSLRGLSERCGGRAISCGYTAPFYFHMQLRGLEQSMTDPILNPDVTRALIRHLSDFFTEYHRRCFDAAGGLIDMTQVTDDFGSQQGLLISPLVFDEFYRAPLQRAIDLAKSYNLIVFHHDDGDIRQLLPRLAEMGIDLLNPIQWRCGDWDLAALKNAHGARLCFHGAVDTQRTLPLGTPDEVREEVKRLIGTLACDRTGFILGPCHNLQPHTPVGNILAMYEAAHAEGLLDA